MVTMLEQIDTYLCPFSNKTRKQQQNKITYTKKL